MTLVGIDEVGRGPIAGPVAACALAVLDPELLREFADVRESKQLTAKGREKWFSKIEDAAKAQRLRFTLSFQSEKLIDEINIRQATLCAANEAAGRLRLPAAECEVRLDGGLILPPIYSSQKTIIRGDASEPVIALASIAAKVLRDRRMDTLGAEYPQYGFERHKGYGTRGHYEALKKYGLLPCHRRSFLKSFVGI